MADYIPKLDDILLLLPGAAASALLIWIGAILHGRGSRKIGAALTGLAFAVGCLVTWLQLHDWQLPIPPNGASERGLYGIVLFGLVSALVATAQSRPGMTRLLHYLVVGGVAWAMLQPLLERELAADGHVSSLHLLIVIGLVLFLWTALECIAERVRHVTVPITLAMVMTAAGFVLFGYGSSRLAQIAGTAAIALVLIALLFQWFPGRELPRAAVGGFVGVIACLFIDAYHYASDTPPAVSFGLLAGTPLLLSMSMIPRIHSMPTTRRFAMQMTLVFSIVAVAFWIAHSHLPAPSEYDPR